MMSNSRVPRHLQKTMRGSTSHSTPETMEIYILVMGLTGAGKSTFISVVTEDPTIPIGEQDDMDGGEFGRKGFLVKIPL